MFNFTKAAFSKKAETVAFDDRRVVRTLSSGGVEEVLWEDLKEVVIVTTDDGPLADDVFWLLLGEGGGCAVPSNASGAEALLARLQELPRFDNTVVIAAMGSTANDSFVVWRRDD